MAALPQLGVRAEAGRAIELKENATQHAGFKRLLTAAGQVSV